MSIKDIIKKHEGLRLEAYPDPGSGGDPWTIGYGHTKNVKKGDKITVTQAEVFLDEDMFHAYSVVDRLVTVPLTRQQRDALCSFVFNVGGEALRKSTLLKLLNQGKYKEAADQLLRWNKASGKVMTGLTTRRKEERALFLSGTGLTEEVFPIEKEANMAPFLVAAIPTLIQALPEFAKIFQKKDVAERNVEALEKAVEIVVQATGATNVQEAVEMVEKSPEVAQEANTALRVNRAELLDILERFNKMEQENIQAAREFSSSEPYMVSTSWLKLKFIHILSVLFVAFSGTFVSMNWESLTPELKGAVITLMVIAGWNGVRDYWMGSSSGSDKKTEQLMK
jgi:lysozyme